VGFSILSGCSEGEKGAGGVGKQYLEQAAA